MRSLALRVLLSWMILGTMLARCAIRRGPGFQPTSHLSQRTRIWSRSTNGLFAAASTSTSSSPSSLDDHCNGFPLGRKRGRTRDGFNTRLSATHQAGGGSGSSTSNNDEASILNEVEATLKGPCQIKGGDSIVIAVSGGADSMALLHLLQKIVSRWDPPLRLGMAHFNHGLRPEAEEEESFVRQVAADLNISVHVSTWDVENRSQKTGIQERARKWRRAECQALLQSMLSSSSRGEEGGGAIATAHHADDQIETFVLKLLRGTHLSHLRGMDFRRNHFIKPLLNIPKDRLIGFLQTNALEWREDASNQEDKYKRNKVRLQLLPLMREIAGGNAALKARAEELSSQSRALDDWLCEETKAWEEAYVLHDVRVRPDELPLVQKEWGVLPRLVKEEILHRYVDRVAEISLRYHQIRRIMDHIERGERQWRLYIAEGWVLDREGEVLRLIMLPPGEQGVPSAAAEEEVEEGGFEEAAGRGEEGRKQVIFLPEAQVEVHLSSSLRSSMSIQAARLGGVRNEEEENGGEGKWGVVLCNVPLGAKLHIRPRKDGDRFHPTWRSHPTKLKDFLRGQRIPLHRRDEVLVIAMYIEEGGEEDGGGVANGEVILALYPRHMSQQATLDEGKVPPLRIRLL